VSYKIRNSIALAILLILVVGVGSFIRAYQLPKRVKAIDTEIKKIDAELQDTPNLINQFNDLSTTLTDVQKRWENRNKDIPPVDITSQSYAYFSRIIDLSGFIKLDMIYQGVQNFGSYGYNIYQLKGEGSFDNLYRFVWYLENDRKLYKVHTIFLRGVETAPTALEPGALVVTFDMTVHAYFSSVSELSSSLGERSITPNALAVDPFTPTIASGIPPNVRALVEIERAELRAVIPGKAFVLDQANVIRTLQEGDEVYLGYVTKIDPGQGRLECTLNKGGIIEKTELKIRYGPPSAGPQTAVHK
jgi:hypothetical protein